MILAVLVSTSRDLAILASAWLASAVVATGALVDRHLLGGPAVETRGPLASASAMRFPALALLLATVAPLGKRLVPVVAADIVVSLVAVAVYGRFLERRGRKAGVPR